MPCKVAIRFNPTGVVHIYEDESDWDDANEWMWTEGNCGCDCNRAIFFKFAVGEDDGGNDQTPCGDELYSVPYVELPSGARIELEE
jgi:hypothetical protein